MEAVVGCYFGFSIELGRDSVCVLICLLDFVGHKIAACAEKANRADRKVLL